MQPYEQLEHEFQEWVDWGQHVACSSGTAALHLALEALDLPPGSKVVVPEFAMVACARAVVLAGLVPVFVDCGEDLLLDVDLLRRRIPSGTRAVMAVHVYGRRCDMDGIFRAIKGRNVAVVEDLAEAHGVTPHSDTAAACWSFYRNKIIAGEEGGMVAFGESRHAEAARRLRNMGHPAAHDFLHHPRGCNYRLANLLAEPILASLRAADANIQARREVERFYNLYVPRDWQMPPRDAVWVYDLRLPGCNGMIARLNAAGIAARCAFKPMSQQPEFRSGYRHLRAYRLSREVMYLPVQRGMGEEEIKRTTAALLQTAMAAA